MPNPPLKTVVCGHCYLSQVRKQGQTLCAHGAHDFVLFDSTTPRVAQASVRSSIPSPRRDPAPAAIQQSQVVHRDPVLAARAYLLSS